MTVNGPGSIGGPNPIDPVRSRTPPKPASGTPEASPLQSPTDEVDISSAGQKMHEISESSEMRAARLDEIRAEIEAGRYDTPEKLEAALEKMLQSLQTELDEDEA